MNSNQPTVPDHSHEVMLFGLMTAAFLAYFLRWRRHTLAPRGTPEDDGVVKMVVAEHLVELAIILVPFIVLGVLGLVKGNPAHILLDNELALAAAVLCCHKIVEIGSSHYPPVTGISPQLIEQCRADNKKWQTYLILNLVLAIVAIASNSLIEAERVSLWSAALRYSVFFCGVAMFLRFGVSHGVTERVLLALTPSHESNGSVARTD